MANYRTLPEKVQDVKTTYSQFRELLTPPVMRELHDQMTDAQKQAAISNGDVQVYVNLVQAGLALNRIVSGNDRTALMAAVMATQSGVSRPQLEVVDDGHAGGRSRCTNRPNRIDAP